MLLSQKGEQDSYNCRAADMATYLPFSDVVAAYGYRQPPPARQRVSLLMLAFAYVIMGSALGTVAGTGLAMASFHSAGIPTLVFQVAPPVQASPSVESVAKAPQQLPLLMSHAIDVPASVAKPSPLKLAKASLQVTHQHYAHHRSVQPKQIAIAAVSTDFTTPSPVMDAAPALPAVVETGTENYKFVSEGDVTVADFDASTGRIESYEGRTFVLGAMDVAWAASSLQDSGSSVHYRCDQSGSCTLMRAGLVLQNVRLM
jgi:hypothetical protein